jgi:NIMA (never in mitosis gene a)-related kinase
MLWLQELEVKAMGARERQDAANEVRLLASMLHPNIIQYKEAFVNRDKLCIIMELATKGDLAKVIKVSNAARQRLHEDDVWSFFIQMARGIQVRPARIAITS